MKFKVEFHQNEALFKLRNRETSDWFLSIDKMAHQKKLGDMIARELGWETNKGDLSHHKIEIVAFPETLWNKFKDQLFREISSSNADEAFIRSLVSRLENNKKLNFFK